MELSKLNPSQRQAVENTEGPVMILAGAGSGKTRTLVSRIQYLIEEKNISPFQILAVTFSNKAAREMRERVAHTTGHDMNALQITTFHSFCSRVLRMEAEYIGLSKSFTIYDDSESKTVAKHILGKRGVNPKEIPPSALLYYIDNLKNNGYYQNHPKRDEDEEIIADKTEQMYLFYQDYENELAKSNAIDFGGLITGTIQLFEKHPQVLERYRRRYKYILVDEYQDTNRAQFILINHLAKETRNLCVVGDEDQSIYSWRGADIRNILDFEKIYHEAKIFKLEQNYRSSKNIIEAASHVISLNQQRKGKEMWTDNDAGDSIDIVECPDDRDESQFLVDEIKKLTKAGAVADEIAVFYRSNAQSRVLEDALRKEKIHYRIVGGIKFYERKEIKDLLAYLRVVVNPKDSLALSRIINTPPRGVGTTSMTKIENEAISLQCSLFEVMEKIIDSPQEFTHLKLSAKVRSSLGALISLLQEAQVESSQNASPHYLYEKLLHGSGYADFLRAEKTHESVARIENLSELANAILQYEDENKEANLIGFLETITLDTQKDENAPDQPQVSLMTVHSSKGLEYPYVFVVGVEESMFPSFQSMEGGDMAIEEERRLFYVAMTRAMKKLYITFSQARMLWGTMRFNGPSRFINEIPENYYNWKSLTKKSQQFTKSSNSFDDFSQETSQYDDVPSTYQKQAAQAAHKFQSGIRVRHSLYGTGTVMESEGFGNDEKVVIKFNDGARKKFMVKFAPLEKI
ncbi:MAG: UvrD-helicase domain-containing protein [Bacteriovoracaceae bacterium]|nr:UvrD-helicase domain-containing protein [Bacteriovoracaceae bacterium]